MSASSDNEATGEVVIRLTLDRGKIRGVRFEPEEWVEQLKEMPDGLEGVVQMSCMSLLSGITSDCRCGYIFIELMGRLYKICIPCIKQP